MVQLHQALPLVERQHALIEEMRALAPRFVAGRTLAERTGTSQRTVERDIVRLVDAGLPIEVRRGPGGGYRVGSPAPRETIVLTAGEIAALVASLVAIGPYTSSTAHSVLGKLLGTFGHRAVSDGRPQGRSDDMDAEQNIPGTVMTCTNESCGCELQIIVPCPHGTTYVCACGHPFEAVAQG